MRVAIVYRNFNLGGSIERANVLLARALVAEGVEVHCYCNPETSTAPIDGAVMHDVRPPVTSRSRLGRAVETGSFAAAATRALRRAGGGRYDVVHVDGTSAWHGDVFTVHGVTAANQRRWPSDDGAGYRAASVRARLAPVLRPQVGVARAVERLQFRRSSLRAIAVTDQVARDLAEVHGLGPARVDVIPLPVDVERFGSARGERVREKLQIDPDARVLLFVGHDFARKGLGEAIAALAALPQDVVLLVVGGGDQKAYEQPAREAGVAGRVRFAGGTESPEAFYAAADVLVLPTRQEPWGIPIIEAMAAGVPVVTTVVAGAASVLAEAGAGIVLEGAEVEALGHALEPLLERPELRRELGVRGRRAAARFGIGQYRDAVLAVYERVTRGAPASAPARVEVGPA